MTICSLYTLTYSMPDGSALVLADIGDDLVDEPVFDGMQEVQVYQPIKSPYAKVKGRGNVPRTVTFSRAYKLDTPNDAREFELDQMYLLDGMVKSSLTIQLKDSATYVMADALLVGAPRAKDTDALPPEYAVMDYIIYGGKLAKQLTPDSDQDVFVIDGSDYFSIDDSDVFEIVD